MTQPNSNPLSFGALLKRHRRLAGHTQEQFAEVAGYSAAYISMLERGARFPVAATAELLAAAVQLNADDRTVFLAAAARGHAQSTGEARDDVLPLPVGTYLGAAPDTPLVARTAEVGAIEAALTAALAGSGRCVIVAGEPGIGKTRLAQEAAQRARRRGFLVATGRCYESQQAVAFVPFVEALGVLHAAAPAAMRDELLQRWPELRHLLPSLHGLPEPTRPHLSPRRHDEQQQLFWQVAGFVLALGATRPMALLLDDLQWADEASLGLLQHLVRHTNGARVLLLATCRNDAPSQGQHALRTALHELQRERLFERLTLHPLAADDMAALVTTSLGGESVAEDLAKLIQRTTDGNPFFAQEVLRMLIERGDLALDADGQWGRRTEGDIDVPETVRDAIGVRLARLRPATRDVLRQASVLGQEFSFAALSRMRMGPEAATGQSGAEHDGVEVEVEEALEEALVAGLLREIREPEYRYAARYGFSHALTQRAIYTEISVPRRRRLHRAAGAALEGMRAGKQLYSAAELARHFLAGDAVARALPYTLAAGDQAEALYAHGEAERHYRLASELARELGEQAREAEAQEKLAVLLDILACYDEAIAAAARAAALWRALGDRERFAWTMGILARACDRAGRQQVGEEHLRSAVAFLAPEEHEEHGHPMSSVADLAGMRAERALASLTPRVAARLAISLANYLTQLRHPEDGLSAIQQAIVLAQAAGDQQLLGLASTMQGTFLLKLGRLSEAWAVWQAAASFSKAAGDDDILSVSLSNMARIALERGDLNEARRRCAQTFVLASRVGDPHYIGICLLTLADIEFVNGNWGEARTNLERASATSDTITQAVRAALGRLDLIQGNDAQGIPALDAVVKENAAPRGLNAVAGAPLRALCALSEHDLVAERAAAARARLEPLLERTEQAESDVAALVLPLLAWSYDVLGREEQAATTIMACIERTSAGELRLGLVEALRVRALLAIRQGRWQEAEQTLQEVVLMAQAMPYPYAEAKALSVYGRLHVARGELAQARARFAQALALLGRLGERLYAQHIERTLAALPVEVIN